jgi:anti-sigma factor RsiW
MSAGANPTAGETMSCSEFVELVTDYLEGRLAPGDAERFEAHLDLCDGCQAYVEQMRMTLMALGRIPEETISAEARAELLHVFAEFRSGASPG